MIALFTIHHLPFTVCSPFTVHRKRLTDNVWKTEDSKWLIASGGSV